MTAATSLSTPPPDEIDEAERRYSRGLAAWREGRGGDALDIWASLPDPIRATMRDRVDAARLEWSLALLHRNELGEAAAVLRGVATQGPEAQSVRRAVVIAALRGGQRELGRACAAELGETTTMDQALAALARPAGARPLETLVRASRDPQLTAAWRRALRRAAAAEAIAARRRDVVNELIAADGDDPELRLVECCLDPGARDPLSAGALPPASLRKLHSADGTAVGEPDASASAEARASFWIAVGRHEAACELLSALVKERPFEPRLVRSLAVASYVRASLALPSIALEAWRDCFACWAAFLENERWMRSWVLARLSVYEVADEPGKRADELKNATSQLLEKRLSTLALEARTAGDTDNAGRFAGLIAELERERRTAATMWSCGEYKAGGETVAFGPLFARRTGIDVGSFFATRRPSTREAEREDLRALLRAIGRSDEEVRRVLADETKDSIEELRRCFSELGEASALRSAGDPLRGREAALRVFVRWAPPGEPDADELARSNPGYSGHADGVARIRSDAARMISEMSVSAFRDEISSAHFDAEETKGRLRAILAEAVALGCDDEARGRLTRLVLGKQEQLLERKTLEACHTAATIMRQARKAGLERLERRSVHGLTRYADLLRRLKRYQQAASYLKEAWDLQPSEPTLAGNWVATLLEHHEQLLAAELIPEAAAALDAIEVAVGQCTAAFPATKPIDGFPRLITMLRAGIPLSQLVEMRKGDEAEKVPPAPPHAVEALEEAQARRKSGQLAAAQAAVERALQAGGEHPEVIARAVPMVLRYARTSAPDEGRGAFDRLEERLLRAERRYPDNELLLLARIQLRRYRPLHHAATPLQELHRKAVLQYSAKDFGGAAETLKIVFSLSAHRDAEVCLLLAECLARHALDGAGSGSDDVGEALGTAERLARIGSELEPEHPGVDEVRALVARARRESR